jgi:hypothetical protein
MNLSATINQLAENFTERVSLLNQAIQMNRLNARLPIRAIYTAPATQKKYWFDVTAIEFDASSLNEQTGEWGVFQCSGVQYIEKSDGQWMPMTRVIPAYTLSAAN